MLRFREINFGVLVDTSLCRSALQLINPQELFKYYSPDTTRCGVCEKPIYTNTDLFCYPSAYSYSAHPHCFEMINQYETGLTSTIDTLFRIRYGALPNPNCYSIEEVQESNIAHSLAVQAVQKAIRHMYQAQEELADPYDNPRSVNDPFNVLTTAATSIHINPMYNHPLSLHSFAQQFGSNNLILLFNTVGIQIARDHIRSLPPITQPLSYPTLQIIDGRESIVYPAL